MSLVQFTRDAPKCTIHKFDPSRRYFMALEMVNAYNGTGQQVLMCLDCKTQIDRSIQERHRHQVVKLTRLEKEMGYSLV